MNMETHITPEKFITRRLTKEDWKKYKDLRLESVKDAPKSFGRTYEEEVEYSDEYWIDLFKKEDRFTYAVENDNKLASIGTARKFDEDDWRIIAVYTTPKDRGKKLSTQVINSISGELSQKGVKKVKLMVNIEQDNAISVYKKLGFETTGIIKDQKMADGKSYDLFIMEKELKIDKNEMK